MNTVLSLPGSAPDLSATIDGIDIVTFYDGSGGSSGYTGIGDFSTFLTGYELRNATTADIVSGNLNQLINDRDPQLIHQMYYGLTITKPSQFTKFSNQFTEGFLEYNADLITTLPNQINTYDKLFFGNLILVDFVQASNAIDIGIDLNLFYSECNDDTSASLTCAADTSLSRDYKTSGTSPDCVTDPSLETNCERSCGSCPSPSTLGSPGSTCTDSSSCNSAIYDAAGTSSTNLCKQPTSDEEPFIGSDNFCLSPFALADCGTISSDTCANDDTATDTSCTSYCSDNFQCESGYCNSAIGQCC